MAVIALHQREPAGRLCLQSRRDERRRSAARRAADCTGFKSATLSVGPTVDFDFVLDDSAREIRMIVSDDGFAVSGSARSLDTHSKSRE